jgi:hypothetical protein
MTRTDDGWDRTETVRRWLEWIPGAFDSEETSILLLLALLMVVVLATGNRLGLW